MINTLYKYNNMCLYINPIILFIMLIPILWNTYYTLYFDVGYVNFIALLWGSC